MATAKHKGNVLEQVVAWLHEAPGVRVERQVQIPAIAGGRGREIDVLLSASVSGHDVRLAIECKNQEGKVQAPQIDAFRGKLEAIGIPLSLGIYVAPHGYTQGAIEAAQVAGIKLLTLDGLSADRLSLEVQTALQSVIVLVPEVVQLNVVNDLSETIGEIGDAFLFYDEHGEPAGTVADFVWEAWLKGNMSPTVGSTLLSIDLPHGWHNVIGGRRRDIQAYGVTVNIVAMALTFTGQAHEATLSTAPNGAMLKHGMRAQFSPPQGRYSLQVFETEQALDEYIRSHGLVHVAIRVKCPRIKFWNMMFWPPSQRVADTIEARMVAFGRGEVPDPRPFSFEEIEGTDLSAAWEPIADEYLEMWNEREREIHGATA